MILELLEDGLSFEEIIRTTTRTSPKRTSELVWSTPGQSSRTKRFMSSVAGEHASFVVSLLEKLMGQERGPWFLIHEGDTIRTMLKVAVSSGDEQARSCAVRVINLFGERGDERYRDLLRR